VKRTELIKKILDMGCTLVRHGAKHDWYQNATTRASQPVPRHNEISDSLAKHILKMLGDS
jgi:mRNA interferase HicA